MYSLVGIFTAVCFQSGGIIEVLRVALKVGFGTSGILAHPAILDNKVGYRWIKIISNQ